MAKTTLTLLGQFAIAYNVSMVLHELGHVTGAVLTGGGVESVSLNPFCWSWVRYTGDPSPIVSAWSGVAGGVLFSLLPCVGLRLVRRPVPRLAIILGIIAMARDGVYLLGGTFANVGDGADIVRLGAPRSLPIAVGVLLLATAALWFIFAQARIGIPYSATLAKRSTMLLGGFGTYLVVMFAYVAVFHRRELVSCAVFVGAGVMLLATISSAATLAPKYHRRLFADSAAEEISWLYAVGHLLAGTVVVVVEIAVFGV